jgi:phospholipid-binding lipoprotein MlaA
MKLERLLARTTVAGLLAAVAMVLAGCATSGAARNPRDPYESLNRDVYRFNEDLDRVLLVPAATWYRDKVPPLVRTGVSNFFGNLSDVWSAVNALLQFHLQDFEENLARVHVNTMFGVFGIFDVASELNIERHREDFGQTLGRWGVGAGPYLVLPFLGPSTMRDAFAWPIDRRFDVVRAIDPASTRDVVQVVRVIDKRANLLRVTNVLEGASLDKYSFTRDAYLQRRRSEVFDHDDGGRNAPASLPDESKEPADRPAAAPAGQPASAPAR